MSNQTCVCITIPVKDYCGQEVFFKRWYFAKSPTKAEMLAYLDNLQEGYKKYELWNPEDNEILDSIDAINQVEEWQQVKAGSLVIVNTFTRVLDVLHPFTWEVIEIVNL